MQTWCKADILALSEVDIDLSLFINLFTYLFIYLFTFRWMFYAVLKRTALLINWQLPTGQVKSCDSPPIADRPKAVSRMCPAHNLPRTGTN